MRNRKSTTAKELAKILNCKCKINTLPRHREFIINYGNHCPEANLNSHITSNKFTQLRKLEAGGILVPKTFNKNENIPNEMFPVLGRRKFHTQGKDIIYIANKRKLANTDPNKYDFLVQYIEKDSEYRVHILGEDTLMVTVKIAEIDAPDMVVRAKRLGWKQIEYNGRYLDQLAEIGLETIRILGWDFGAVDIMRQEDQLYVLEANAAPGLEDRKLELYANWFRKKEEEWRQHR